MANVETESVARCIQSSAIAIFCFEKWSENLLLIFLADTDSMVNNAYLNFYHIRFSGHVVALDLNLAVFGRKLDCIRDQVQQNLDCSHLINLQLDVTAIELSI